MLKSLIVKDILNLKRNIIVLFFITILYSFLFIPTSGPETFTALSITMFSAASIISFSFDEESQWNTFALSTPISRKDLIVSKFALLLLFSLFGLVSGIVLSLVFSFKYPFINVNDYLVYCLLFLCISLDLGSLDILFITKFGINVSKTFIIAFYVIPYLLVLLVVKFLSYLGIDIPDNSIFTFSYIQPILTIFIMWISYKWSYKIIQKKDF